MAPDQFSFAKNAWFLVGPFGTSEAMRHLPIYTSPFGIGRREDLPLSLPCEKISVMHAEIINVDGSLVLRDRGSTNGTFVNGRRITEPVELHENDLVQFASTAFRVLHQTHETLRTIHEDARDQALALVQFDKLMAEHAVNPHFQPIVTMSTGEVEGYEVLARSGLFGLETPKEMFGVASLLNLEVELSVMLRWEGVQASLTTNELPHLFLNTHPKEMEGSGLVASLQELRVAHPNQQLTLEIHEATVTNAGRMAAIRPALTDLGIGLAYDDFGSGQSRLNEMSEGWLDYVKFDISLIRDIHAAPPHRQQMVATLVQLVKDLGIRSVSEGVETAAESETCSQMGFELGQGFLYGRPAPIRVT